MYRPNTILASGDLTNANHVHSGVKVVSVDEVNKTLKLRRIADVYLRDTVEEWEMKFWQMEKSMWKEVIQGQLPLL